MFDRSKLESLCEVSVTRIGYTFPTVFRTLRFFRLFLEIAPCKETKQADFQN